MSQNLMKSNIDFETEKLMLITISLNDGRKGARESLNRLNAEFLKEIYKERLHIHELPDCGETSALDKVAALCGYMDGISGEYISSAIREIKCQDINKIFIDGSNLGRIAKKIKENCPGVSVITYFQNVEARFFWGALKEFKTLKSFLILIANYLTEKKAVNYSDLRIMLNRRDSEMLARIYGKAATHILPLVVPDIRTSTPLATSIVDKGRYALFVGGSFYANQSGIEWYARNVAPNVDIKTVIVGRGFERLKEKLEVYDNVEVIGEVESIGPWYEQSDFVVAPIFDGSGMKTKVAEALMFGKKIIGTPEAFQGYEDSLPTAGVVCETVGDFVDQVQKTSQSDLARINPEAVRLYEMKYSPSAGKARLKAVLQE